MQPKLIPCHSCRRGKRLSRKKTGISVLPCNYCQGTGEIEMTKWEVKEAIFEHKLNNWKA